MPAPQDLIRRWRPRQQQMGIHTPTSSLYTVFNVHESVHFALSTSSHTHTMQHPPHLTNLAIPSESRPLAPPSLEAGRPRHGCVLNAYPSLRRPNLRAPKAAGLANPAAVNYSVKMAGSVDLMTPLSPRLLKWACTRIQEKGVQVLDTWGLGVQKGEIGKVCRRTPSPPTPAPPSKSLLN